MTCSYNNHCHRFYHPHLSCYLRLFHPFLYCHLPVQTMTLRIQEFQVNISYGISPRDVGFVEGTWGIDYFRWWSRFVDPPWMFCTGIRSILLLRRKSSALCHLWVRLLAAVPCMSQNSMNVTLVSHIPEALCADESLWWTWRHQHFCWSTHTTVYWILRLGEKCRR